MTMSRQVNISQNANDIQISTTQNRVVVIEGGNVDITVTQPVTSVVEVLTGPMGPKGDLSTSGSVSFTGSYVISGSLVVSGSTTSTQGFTGSLLGTSSWAINAETASYVNPLTQNVIITGSLTVSGSSTFTNIGPAVFSGSVTGRDGFTSSFLGNLEGTASYVEFSSVDGLPTFSSSVSSRIVDLENFSSSLDATFATDAQLNAATASLSASISSLSSSYLNTSASFSSGINANAGDITALSSSFVSFSSSYNTGSYTGSFTGDGGGLYNIPASGIVGLNLSQISSGSVSASISPDNGLQVNTNTTVAGDLIIQGTASITYLNVTYESASVIYSSGSNQFGDAADDTQTLYGTVLIQTGSLTVTGSVTSTDGFTGSLFGTSSWATNATTASYILNAVSSSYSATASYVESAQTASYVLNAVSASYAQTASYIQLSGVDGFTSYSSSVSSSISALSSSFISFSASYNTGSFTGSFTGNLQGTSSWATNAISSSYALTSISASYALSASHAISASYALTASYVNPLIQNVIITGSLFVTQSHISTVDYIDYTLLTTVPVHAEGRVHWLDDTKTLQIDTDVSNFSVEVGHQNVVRVRNTTGYNLAIGKIVYINGESGNRPTVTTASWDGDPTSATTLGFVAQQINDNQTGYVVTNGMLRGINTSTYSPGTQLYLSSSGDFTSTIPLSPKHEVRLGKIVTQAVNGTIYVDIMNGYEIGELHDVLVVSSSAGDLLVKSGSLWINTKQLTGSYGLTGSLQATSFTGSLLGTSSYAVQALSSSFALTASYIDGGFY